MSHNSYDYNGLYNTPESQSSSSNPVKRRACDRCKGTNITYQVVHEELPTSIGATVLYIILSITIIGLLIVFPLMLRKRTRTVTYAVCQDCGHRWVIQQN